MRPPTLKERLVLGAFTTLITLFAMLVLGAYFPHISQVGNFGQLFLEFFGWIVLLSLAAFTLCVQSKLTGIVKNIVLIATAALVSPTTMAAPSRSTDEMARSPPVQFSGL